MGKTRSEHVKLNILAGYIVQFFNIFLSFVGRMVFLNYLSAEYLGINSLYSNVLAVLSLAEMGIDSAATYTLYKPVARNVENEIVAYVIYFRKLYRRISVCIMGVGLCLIPFLHYVVHSNIPTNEVEIYYIIFLLNSTITYFVADKVAFLFAKQEQRITKYVMLLTQMLNLILQILILIITQNFLFYLLMMLLSTVVYNLIITYVCRKRYPYLKRGKGDWEISKSTITERIKSTILYKVGAILINNTDNVLISSLVSTYAVGIYSNYFMIVSGLQGFIAVVTTALMSGLGNVVAKNNRKRAKELFFTLLLFYQIVATVGALEIYFCADDFITLWLGKQFVVSSDVLMAIMINFYMSNLISPIWMYREVNGLFNQVKYLMLVNAALNLIMSFFLGRYWGMSGVLFATVFSRIMTLFWYEPHLLFRVVFKESSFKYWIIQLKALSTFIFIFYICSLFVYDIQGGICGIIIKALTVISLCSLTYVLISYRTREFAELINFVSVRKRM